MKKLLIFVFCVFAVAEAAAQDLIVASYNVRFLNDNDIKTGNGWEQRAPWLCGLIEFEGFDIFGAQEVRHVQLNDMLQLMPDYSYIGVGRDDGATKGEYTPIFYKTERFELLDSGHFWLSKTPEIPSKSWDAALPRICSWGHFADGKTGRRFWFFNLHMDHVGVHARVKSARLVIRQIKDICPDGECVILTGDFNVDQGNEVYQIFADSALLSDSFETAEKRYAPNGTYNTFNPEMKTSRRIDHIFLSPSLRVRNYGVLTETYRAEIPQQDTISDTIPGALSEQHFQSRLPSDHFPVVVKLDFCE